VLISIFALSTSLTCDVPEAFASTLPSPILLLATTLADTLGTSPSSLQRELDSLTAAAILLMRREGRRTYYRANENSAIYQELRGIMRKTMGIPQEVRASLAPIERKISLAMLYGSVARGEERADAMWTFSSPTT
jgi:DNA-binding transcriptional ArsR family regulator